MEKYELIPSPNAEIVASSGVPVLLKEIRPEWQAKSLIQRVNKILPVDPSSACQRMFNAAMHDLREKICIAGLDIAKEAAEQYKLPPVSKHEDIENYSVSRIIDLAYRMGLLSRPEYRRILRAYDIRKDLEHEDDVYEAGVEDCVYIFKTCIDVVLSKDPVHLLKLTDVKDVVESPEPAVICDEVIEDYKHAPAPRQNEIYRFLISTALNKKQADIVRQNCYNTLHSLKEHTQKEVLLETARSYVEKIARSTPDQALVRVAHAAGIFAYFKKAQISAFFKSSLDQMESVGHHWTKYSQHGEMLRNFQEIGGLKYCPTEMLPDFALWFVQCYVGEPGGYGAGYNRNVFFSNVGAPLSLDILKEEKSRMLSVCEALETEPTIRRCISNQHLARRFERLLEDLG
ncbi:TPA: hypothetical protein RQK35_003408 [Vibrio vulnificus]|nr:hypothetical protein [Vibrio vulnificus]